MAKSKQNTATNINPVKKIRASVFQLSTETIKDISEKYITDEMKDEITQKILKFLEDNKTYLPMYAISSVIEKILQNYTTSPLFQ